jgi:hypothetical protein
MASEHPPLQWHRHLIEVLPVSTMCAVRLSENRRRASVPVPGRPLPTHPIFPWALGAGVHAGTGSTGTTYDGLLTSARPILSDISRNSPLHWQLQALQVDCPPLLVLVKA